MPIATFPFLLTTRQAAEILGTTEAALRVERAKGRSDVPYVRTGKKRVRYDPAAIAAYIEAHTVTPKAADK